jgi:hypothetical protein
MKKFISMKQGQGCATAHAAVHNLFYPSRHLVRAEHNRSLRRVAFEEWGRAIA